MEIWILDFVPRDLEWQRGGTSNGGAGTSSGSALCALPLLGLPLRAHICAHICPYKLLLGRVFRNIITCATGRMYQLSTWDLDGEKYGESPYKTDALDAPKA